MSMLAFLIYLIPFQRVEAFASARVFQSEQVSSVTLQMISLLVLLSTAEPTIHRRFVDIDCHSNGGNVAMLFKYKLGSFEAKLGAKIASITSVHNIAQFDYEEMISPLLRRPSLCGQSS